MPKIVRKNIGDICTVAKRNSSLTMEAINSMPGQYPVYAASVGASVGYINSFNNTEPAIVIPTAGNGTAGKPYVVKDEKYTIGANAVGFIPKENVDIDYVFFQLKGILANIVKGESFKSINQGMIKRIEIVLPVKDDETYDFEEQQRMAGVYSEIEVQKERLLKRFFEIDELLIHIEEESDIKYEDIPLNSFIKHDNGNSKYTKTWCQKHKGSYPVYSANNYEPIAFIDEYDYDGEYLTYSKNGCAGFITLIKGRFSVNADRCVMIIEDDFKDKIDLLYLKYYLEPYFRSNKKGRLGEMGKNEFTKLNSSMIKGMNMQVPIPLTNDGSYDLCKQKEIAKRYMQVEEIKKGLMEKLVHLVNISVIPE